MKKLFFALFLILILIGGMIFLAPKPIHLAYMTDAKYLPYVMVSINSAMQNKKPQTNYHVHLIAEEFTQEDIQKVKQMEQKGLKITIYPTEDKRLDISHLGRFSSFQIALQKIFIADYLLEMNKVLYLDGDTLILKDLSDVFKTDISNKYAAAVKDGLMYQHPEHIVELPLRRNFYFNSGVMLLNLQKIRQDKLIRQALIYFNTHHEIFGDQDILNVAFKGEVSPLSYRYNCNSTFFEEKDALFLSAFYEEAIPQNSKEVYENAAILHFAGHKPWTEWFNQQELKRLWQQYADDTAKKYQIKI